MLARMMDDMARPEPAHAVGAAVKGIISEIVEEEAEDPRPPPAFEFDPDVEQAILIHPHRHADHRRADEGARHQNGRASARERGGQAGEIPVVAGSLNKKKNKNKA